MREEGKMPKATKKKAAKKSVKKKVNPTKKKSPKKKVAKKALCAIPGSKKKHPGGRPTKYNKNMLERSIAYLTDFYHYDAVFPSLIGLSLYLEIHKDTVREWGKDDSKPEFSAILAKINGIQHQMLIGNGISGEYNSNIAKLVLGKHGYHEKTETKDTTPRIDLDDDELDRRIRHLESLKEQGLRD